MKHLAMPAPAAADDRVRATVSKRTTLAPHAQAWANAYDAYRASGSDPWAVTPHAFPDAVRAELYGLYDTRKGGGPLVRIRQTEGLLCCPMCGSGTTGSLDHLLPRGPYPEFSIMRANLVPACTHCNSASKGQLHRGPNASERFIHPYFDSFADNALWRIRFNSPYAAATFDAVAEPGLSALQHAIVAYHLAHVLGVAFRNTLRNTWSTYPHEVNVAHAGRQPTPASVAGVIAIDLTRSIVANGINAWRTAFLRGLAADGGAIAHVASAAAAYPALRAPRPAGGAFR